MPDTPQIVQEDVGWTVYTLHEHLIALIASYDVRYTERFFQAQANMQAAIESHRLAVNATLASAERAISKAEAASEKRFDSVNEFRATLADQQRTLMPRGETELLLRSLHERLDVTLDNASHARQITVDRLGALERSSINRDELERAVATSTGELSRAITRINVMEAALANIQGRIWAVSIGITLVSVGVGIVLHFL